MNFQIVRCRGTSEFGDSADYSYELHQTRRALSSLDATPAASANRSMPPILGPQDRESFFEVQARDRRASWKLAAASIFGVRLMASALVLTLAPRTEARPRFRQLSMDCPQSRRVP